MYKKTLTYTDYNGVEKTEDFYFNFTKAELVEMQLGLEGGLAEVLEKISKAQNQAAIISYFKKIVLSAFGEKTGDGRFVKNDEVRAIFESKNAYSDLFMLFATNDEEAAKFINGIIPNGIAEQEGTKSAVVTKLTAN